MMNLTFHWPDYRKVSFALPAFILLSALVHGGAFMLFQTAYPPSGSLISPPATVTLLTPSTPENRAQLRWVDAGDPALASKPQEVVPPELLAFNYRPSYAELNTEPSIGVPIDPEPVVVPSIVDPQALLARLARGNSRAGNSQGASQGTSVRISGGLATRPPSAQWALDSLARTVARTLEPAQFLVGVNAQGRVDYQFLQQSSGDPNLDRAARSLIAATPFASGSELVWGMVSFYWGPEMFAAANNPETPPADHSFQEEP